jgi:hypothetical protein
MLKTSATEMARVSANERAARASHAMGRWDAGASNSGFFAVFMPGPLFANSRTSKP